MRLKSLECQSFLSILGKEFLDLRESRLATARQHAYCELDNCHLSLNACYQSIACLLHCGRGPHTRRMDAEKQRTVAYLSGGGRCFCHQVLITLVTPLHRPRSANAAASVCLYRKQERQWDVGRSTGHVRRWACSLPYPSAGRW